MRVELRIGEVAVPVELNGSVAARALADRLPQELSMSVSSDASRTEGTPARLMFASERLFCSVRRATFWRRESLSMILECFIIFSLYPLVY